MHVSTLIGKIIQYADRHSTTYYAQYVIIPPIHDEGNRCVLERIRCPCLASVLLALALDTHTGYTHQPDARLLIQDVPFNITAENQKGSFTMATKINCWIQYLFKSPICVFHIHHKVW